jgi:hypothetical protein
MPADAGRRDASMLDWDATTRWDFDPDEAPRGVPMRVDEGAYVSGGVLVAHPAEGSPLGLGFSDALTLGLYRGVLTARLTPTGMTEGVLGGGIRVESLQRGISELGLCPGDDFYCAITDLIRNSADLQVPMLETPSDCTGMSVGIGFRAVAAEIGCARDRPATTGRCPDAGSVGCDGGR